MDGVGEWATTSAGLGDGHHLEIFQEIHFPHSLGLLYSALTYYTGFKVNSGEYKVMGLAPYGQPKYAKLILDNLIDVKTDGSFRLNMSYFDYCTGLTMTNDRFAKLFGAPVRGPDKLLTAFHMDLAASIQAVWKKLCCGSPAASPHRPAREICAWLEAWLSIASPMARFCGTGNSTKFGFSRRREMPEGPWARRSPPSLFKDQPRKTNGSDSM